MGYYTQQSGSYLSKFCGLHAIKLYSLTIYFVVMSNVFPPKAEPQETYDVKGSWVARHTNHHSDAGKLMKDEDLHKQLLLDAKVSGRIYSQLHSDSLFLEQCDIMDYSLLLGIYYMGIDPQKMGCQEDKGGDGENKEDDEERLRREPRKTISIKYMDDEQQTSHFYRK